MRILTVSHSYPRRPGDVPGAFIERMLLALEERGHDVRVIVPADQGVGGTASVSGIPVRRMRYAPARLETLAYRGNLKEQSNVSRGAILSMSMVTSLALGVYREAGAHGSDLVHAHWWIPGGVAAWLARQFGAPPYVVTLHGTDVHMLSRSGLFRAVGRSVLHGARRVTTVSRFLAVKVAAITGLPLEAIDVQPMPAAVERYTATSTGGAGLVTVGRLTQQKRIHLALEAVAMLRTDGVDIPFRIIGDGPERDSLVACARSLGVDDLVEFTGTVDPPEVSRLLGNADACVFPAEWEGLGLGAAEALMAGIPVIATTDGGGILDIVGGEEGSAGGGLVVPPRATEIADAVRAILADPAARDHARAAGASLRERLTARTVAGRFEALYQAALSENQASHA